MDKAGKAVLITGASSGIGEETAYRFAKDGANLLITYNRGKDAIVRVAERCRALGASDVVTLHLDVMDDASIKDCVKKAVARFKKIDILINNAGVLEWKELKEQTFQDIELQLRTNLEGLIKMTKEALPHIREAIVNISSGLGKSGMAGSSAYSASKFGVRGFTQSLARETDLRIVSVNPGTTSTRMTDYSGVPAEKVAEVVFEAATGKIKPDNNFDIDVWKYA